MYRNLALIGLLCLVALAPGCSRDSWVMDAPGLNEPAPTQMSFTATCNEALDGFPAYITGNVISLSHPDTLVPIGVWENGHVSSPYTRWVWGTENFTVGLWYKSLDNRMNKVLDISVNGQQLLSSRATEWSFLRSFQLYVQDGQVRVNPGVVDSVMNGQIWYTGTAFNDPNLDWPANPNNPIFWWGTWTTFNYTPHPMTYEANRYTATMKVRKGAPALLRLQKTNGDELRSGVFVGPVGNFVQATELKNLRNLNNGWYAFEYRVTGDGRFENLRPADERRFNITIGGNP